MILLHIQSDFHWVQCMTLALARHVLVVPAAAKVIWNWSLHKKPTFWATGWAKRKTLVAAHKAGSISLSRSLVEETASSAFTVAVRWVLTYDDDAIIQLLLLLTSPSQIYIMYFTNSDATAFLYSCCWVVSWACSSNALCCTLLSIQIQSISVIGPPGYRAKPVIGPVLVWYGSS